MKLLKEVIKIVQKHDPQPIILPEGFDNVYDYLIKNSDKKSDFEPVISDSYLNKKFNSLIPRGWYGFDVGTPIVPDWMLIIDEITDLCVKNDPKLEIHQINPLWTIFE